MSPMNSRKPITAAIFDMDGLLLNTEPFYTEASKRIASKYGKTFDWKVKSGMIGKPAEDSARFITSALHLPMTPEEYLEIRKPILDELFPKAKPMRGAVRLTRHLHQHSVPQAVATSSDERNFALKTSRHQKWFKIFDCIVIGDDPRIRQGKPAPDIFLIAAEQLRVDPEQCLVFEDSPVGVAAARTAGMSVIAVPDPHLDEASVRAADQVLHSLAEFNPADWGLPAF